MKTKQMLGLGRLKFCYYSSKPPSMRLWLVLLYFSYLRRLMTYTNRQDNAAHSRPDCLELFSLGLRYLNPNFAKKIKKFSFHFKELNFTVTRTQEVN